jgi:hypothetical protein
MKDIEKLQEFRRELYSMLNYRADATIELIDALSSNDNARSVIELSLNPLFRHKFSSISDCIDNFFIASSPGEYEIERQMQDKDIMRLIGRYIDTPKLKEYYLLALDVTPIPRPFSYTLEDRTYVYQPNTISGNKPITIGHQYSFLLSLPEKESLSSPPWAVPLIVSRVPSGKTAIEVAVEQTRMLLEDDALPFKNQLCVMGLDSAYSCADYISPTSIYENFVSITRLRGNRVVYRQVELSEEEKASRGHPTWYGEAFSLQKPETWGKPDGTFQTTYTNKHNKKYIVVIEVWYDMLTKGKRDLPMHKSPFTLLRIRLFNLDGTLAFKRSMWLSVNGEERKKLHPIQSWEGYNQRYNSEHFFRFGKQKLLMTAFQTPITEHEENWLKIVQLSSVQLYLARHLASQVLNPWEKHLRKSVNSVASPTQTQRDFARIIRQFGAPANIPKPRGISNGREKGYIPVPKPRIPIVKKGKTTPKKE